MATSDERIERVYKILLVGNSEVGKTSFVERYVNNRFLSQYKSTLGGAVRSNYKQTSSGFSVAHNGLWLLFCTQLISW